MSIYTREFSFTAEGGVATCITLPCHMRAALGHLYIKQIGGTDGFTFTIYDRKGVCTNAVDVNGPGGAVLAIGTNGTTSAKCRFTAKAADMWGLKVGDTVYAKGTGVSAYNILTHTVTWIGDTYTEGGVLKQKFDTDFGYTSAASTGWWQKKPFIDMLSDPDVYQVVNTQTINSGTAFYQTEFNDLLYQNRDNQSETARRLTSALYLQITPGSTGTKTFNISYTAQARHVTD